jgi:hypothetical protein
VIIPLRSNPSGGAMTEAVADSLMQIATIGLDIAKNVFQLHGIDAAERGSKSGSRKECMEATLGLGMPAKDVK